jgi:hypothetical protein
MRYRTVLLGLVGCLTIIGPDLYAQEASVDTGMRSMESSTGVHIEARLQADFEALQQYRPTYPFWRNIFAIPDGRIVYGSAKDGRLLANFPERGNWSSGDVWEDPSLSEMLVGRSLPSRLSERRDEVERLLWSAVGPVIHNPTRGRFLSPHAERYGSFLSEWSEIYERFGVPAEIGLSQAIIESGLNGRARSAARALGLCQWLPRNWASLNRLAPYVLEGYNQTTQAPYCAAYLTVLATMYGSFIPALSEHHAGGVNVGRTVINGERLGGEGTREQYLLGSDFARELRGVSINRYRELFRTYGKRSALYAEMVFGNVFNVERLVAEMSQSPIYAMRVSRNISLAEIIKKTGLSSDEVKRFNPSLVRQVPARANLYLPWYVSEFGRDVSFWHHPADPEYVEVLDDFVHLDASLEEWHQALFVSRLRNFKERFEATGTEEGTVMATILAYVLGDLDGSPRGAILEEFRSSGRILLLFQKGVRELASVVALKESQRLVGVEADGVCGPVTRAALNEYDSTLLATSAACQ